MVLSIALLSHCAVIFVLLSSSPTITQATDPHTNCHFYPINGEINIWHDVHSFIEQYIFHKHNRRWNIHAQSCQWMGDFHHVLGFNFIKVHHQEHGTIWIDAHHGHCGHNDCCNIQQPVHNYCSSSPCQHNGRCENLNHGYQCHCQNGFSGHSCEYNAVKIDHCNPDPCHGHGFCCNEPNGYKCTCHQGYEGRDCSADCNHDPCSGHGICANSANGFWCACQQGYEGIDCSRAIDHCRSNPCVHGSCSSNLSGYTCTCLPGYQGVNCDVNVDHCINNPCVYGNCINQQTSYTCSCIAGYTGPNCNLLCNGVTCQNGGSCSSSNSGYRCDCRLGFTGRHCEHAPDFCISNPCVFGTCTTSLSSYICTCQQGYTGSRCQTAIDYCLLQPCVNGGTCVNSATGFTCQCQPGYTGSNCQDCTSQPCQHFSWCKSTATDYTCQCPSRYTGKNCDILVTNTNPLVTSWLAITKAVTLPAPVDYCQSQPCQHFGWCTNTGSDYKCQCPSAYTGKNCETING